ncbi:MAG: ParA family protein [Chloroflexota bacterium]
MSDGTVISFYSYKGGVGRTMALANIGVLLAQWGYRVLMVDWDVEAPGLEFYFQDYINLQTTNRQSGLVDLIYGRYLREPRHQRLTWEDALIDIPLPDDTIIRLITAGQRNENYFDRLRRIDLKVFYAKQAGGLFFDELREQWKATYDYVLIDSRTGITDFGGISTAQMPDILLILLSPTEQNLSGVVDVARRVIRQRRELPQRYSLPIVPILSRFDGTEEYMLGKEWIARCSETLAEIYDNWLPAGVEKRDFLEGMKIPYISYFSFGEKLPVLEESAFDSTGISYAYQSLAALLARKLESAGALLKNRSSYIRSAQRQWLPSESERDYLRSAERYGIGFDLQRIECTIHDNGSATVRRMVNVQAHTEIGELDVFLLVPEPTSTGQEYPIEHKGVTSLTPGRAVSLNIRKEEFGRSSAALTISPSLEESDSLTYEMTEHIPADIYAVGLTEAELAGRPVIHDYLGWQINRPTKKLLLQVTLPSFARPKTYETEVRFASTSGFPSPPIHHEEQKRLQAEMVESEDGRHVLRLDVNYPVVNLIYVLRWLPQTVDGERGDVQ